MLAAEEGCKMHSALVATVFVAMVVAPCLVALLTGIDGPKDNS